jgi:hypothetical protein
MRIRGEVGKPESGRRGPATGHRTPASPIQRRQPILSSGARPVGTSRASPLAVLEELLNKSTTRARVRVCLATGVVLPLALLACDLPTAPPRFQPVFVVEIAPVEVPVTSTPAAASTERDLTDIDPDLIDRARAGAVVFDLVNPSGAAGQMAVRIEGGGQLVEGTVLVNGGDGQRIAIPGAVLRALMSGEVSIDVSGKLCPAAGCALRPPPFPEVTFRPRIEITFEIGGEG